MNITVQVDEVTLDTAVCEATEYDEDADVFRQPPTVGHLVAAQIVDRLIRTDGWQSFSSAVLQVRTDLIREAVRPLLAEAIAAPVQKTNSYGEPVGGTVTLREVIVEEARKALNAPADGGYSGNRQTFVQKTVAEEVRKVLAAEIAGAVKRAREQVAAEIGQHVAAAVQAGLRAR